MEKSYEDFIKFIRELHDPATFNFSDLESRVAVIYHIAHKSKGKAAAQVYYSNPTKVDRLMGLYGGSTCVLMDELYDVASKEEAIYREALARNPKTKDLFKSKSTNHSFPWYHRNRKY